MAKRMIPVGIAVLLIVILIGVGLKTGLIDKYSYSDETMDMNEYYQIFRADAVPVILGDEVIEDKALVRDGQYYFALDTVKNYLNKRFYYDKTEGLMLYTTPTELYRIPLEQSDYTVNGMPQSFEQPIAVVSEDTVYLSVLFLKQYANFTYEVYHEPDRIQVYLESDTVQTAQIKKDTALRYQGGVKSDVLKQLRQGETVVVLEKMEKWSKVKSSDSIIGYVENKRLTDEGTLERTVEQTYAEPEYTSIHKEGKVNMVWHQVTNATANGNVLELLAPTKGVNVISPTWFYLNSDDGQVVSIADHDYVAAMHERGIEVWALVDNFTSKEFSTKTVLASTTSRTNVIDQLISLAQEYDLDGINVDFEQIDTESGEDYIQFLRELSIKCREKQLVLSVDNYVPTGYTAHYDRKEQGIVVDYVVIMGYDEHYSGSEEAGSVASINYVEQGIKDTVSDVPEQKVINGLPFYTRIWDVTGTVSSEAVGMQKAADFLNQYGVTATWDDETCQNFAEFSTEDCNYMVWLEDAQSIRTKLNVMKQYNLGGVAGWKLGLETPDIWDLIQEYLNSTPSDTESMDAIGEPVDTASEPEESAQ